MVRWRRADSRRSFPYRTYTNSELAAAAANCFKYNDIHKHSSWEEHWDLTKSLGRDILRTQKVRLPVGECMRCPGAHWQTLCQTLYQHSLCTSFSLFPQNWQLETANVLQRWHGQWTSGTSWGFIPPWTIPVSLPHRKLLQCCTMREFSSGADRYK